MSRVAVYKGFRISVIAADGGYVAYARAMDAPVDAGVNLGNKVTAHPRETVETALEAARAAIGTGIL